MVSQTVLAKSFHCKPFFQPVRDKSVSFGGIQIGNPRRDKTLTFCVWMIGDLCIDHIKQAADAQLPAVKERFPPPSDGTMSLLSVNVRGGGVVVSFSATCWSTDQPRSGVFHCASALGTLLTAERLASAKRNCLFPTCSVKTRCRAVPLIVLLDLRYWIQAKEQSDRESGRGSAW